MLQELIHPAAVASAVRAVTAIVFLLLGAYAVNGIGQRVVERVLRPPEGAPNYVARLQRARTLLPLAYGAIRYTVYFVAGLMVLRQLGVDPAPLLASAGVAGLAIGFGAQALIRDSISGFFLLLDGLIQVGDVVTVGPDTGVVEQIGLRTTQIRRFTGEVVTIPNGELTRFRNYTRGPLRAVLTIGVGRKEDLRRVGELLHEAVAAWRQDHPEAEAGEPEVQALLELGPQVQVLRLVIPVQPMSLWRAERELRLRIKERLEAAGVELVSIGPSETAA
ncbi:MAG: mechanosensitive ion channel family protein [Armatimonadota bacterium]|nr:mechanosensitive ion channel family protein [Armatimonadota bacterium]MDR7443700.1 mechanosensitive ion channel family protein [Armatimonadota bacterium]MDR7569897.1 mechanosensitive ion channel family protein [Armatimonadota bacterium]MDR7613772.1 mechanosensitive ion channel family protein [Armatimonadota bacterium]